MMKLVELLVQSDSNRSTREADRHIKMATEGHRHAGKKSTGRKRAGMDRELTEIMEKIDELELKLRQDKKMVQVCEPETRESLDDEENELESADDLKHCQEGREEIPNCQEGNELRSLRDLEDCQEGSVSIKDYQVGRDENQRLFESLMDSKESSIQQGVMMNMGSVDLIVYQEGSRSIPYFQVGRDEQMRLFVGLINSKVSWNQPGEMTEQVNSKIDLDQ
jgi:hypothetical protein